MSLLRCAVGELASSLPEAMWTLRYSPRFSMENSEMTRPSTDNLTPFAHSAQNRYFGCGPANAQGLQLEFLLAHDGSIVCLTAVSNLFEGHPGFVHGGVI